MQMSNEAPLSPVEHIKKRSNYLRGTIVASLADPLTGALAEDDTQLTKFHGFYQQDDRDLRAERTRIMKLYAGAVACAGCLGDHACQRHAAPDHAPGVPVSRRRQG
jgi:sulfite reductase beta subunit-like hemoprotein